MTSKELLYGKQILLGFNVKSTNYLSKLRFFLVLFPWMFQLNPHVLIYTLPTLLPVGPSEYWRWRELVGALLYPSFVPSRPLKVSPSRKPATTNHEILLDKDPVSASLRIREFIKTRILQVVARIYFLFLHLY